MTDNEIVKALECYRNSKIIQVENGVLSIGDILDLINRLQEKDEKRHKVFETKCEELEIAKAEIERLKNAGDNKTEELLRHNTFIKELHEKLKTAKAEAYKEFAEKVISKIAVIMKHIEQNPYDSRDETRGTICGLAHAIGQIKDLLKEMEGRK